MLFLGLFTICLPKMVYSWLTFPKGVRVNNKSRIRDIPGNLVKNKPESEIRGLAKVSNQ